eukprot:CAMPEP_0201519466 /NCGR_PEP_ID=MMETSP0161_2-20130828/10012_1 /ASSEMBLY_ACC=CAM_ASM_000251 /TAXON_ID=180227 /ORGANISM="Neoparamoeba aestuarina, Strain SoJaBio B1-5/56/2" /LENGTH=217 /DNA_ID=CAMNT_0047917503 /DNA_START=46 /DNA_END=695 /DNA_ORIENTATION=-
MGKKEGTEDNTTPKKKKKERGWEEEEGKKGKKKAKKKVVRVGERVRVSFFLTVFSIGKFESKMNGAVVCLKIKGGEEIFSSSKPASVKSGVARWEEALDFEVGAQKVSGGWFARQIAIVLSEDTVKKQKQLAKWKVDLSEHVGSEGQQTHKIKQKGKFRKGGHLSLSYSIRCVFERVGKRRVMATTQKYYDVAQEHPERIIDINGKELLLGEEEEFS